jgi:hypothetical protein
MWASRLSIRLDGPDWVEEKKRRRGESAGIEAKEIPDRVFPLVFDRKHSSPH